VNESDGDVKIGIRHSVPVKDGDGRVDLSKLVRDKCPKVKSVREETVIVVVVVNSTPHRTNHVG